MSERSSPTPAPVARLRTPGAVVAGYRLLRPLAGPGGGDAWLARSAATDQTVCVEVGPPTEALERRVAAQSRVRSPHVLAVLDLATDADGLVVLVCERTDWTLATLLGCRARLAPGEGVTILAPLAAGLAAMHRAGLVHGALAPATVLFCPDGRPVIGGLDSARASLPARGGVADPGLAGDYRAVGNLVAAVATVIDEPARAEFLAVAAWIEDQLGQTIPDSFLGQLECRLFALAPALPVVLVADRRPGATAPGTLPAHRQRPIRAAVAAHGAAWALPRRAAAVVARSGLVGWIARALHGRALAVSLGILLLVATLLAGLALIPDRPAIKPQSGVPSDQPPALRQTAPRQTETSAAPGDSPAESTAAEGEDPVAATESLLTVRASCLIADAATCVPSYAEPRSALADADSHATGREDLLLVDDESRAGVEIVQVFGDAVLLKALPENEKRQPVLVLAVRTDTGWRLRDLFEPD